MLDSRRTEDVAEPFYFTPNSTLPRDRANVELTFHSDAPIDVKQLLVRPGSYVPTHSRWQRPDEQRSV